MNKPMIALATAGMCLLLAAPALAKKPPNPCTGKAETACTVECSWTKSYTTKKGRTVAAYCHRTPKNRKKTAG